MDLKGIYPIVPTPFDQEGMICEASIDRLASFMIERKVDGLTVLGVMGEGHKLEDAERALVVQRFRQALPPEMGLLVGVRYQGTDLVIRAADKALALGADGILLGPPTLQSDDALFHFHRQVAGAIGSPLVIHDYPAATKVVMSPGLIGRIVNEVDAPWYIKLEDPPTGLKMARLNRLCGENLGVFGALGGMFAFEELDRGAVGIMTGFAYPEFLVQMYDLFCSGQRDAAMALFYDMLPLIRFEFQAGIGVALRKHILVERGVFQTANVREPTTKPDQKTIDHLNLIITHLRGKGYQL
ncbi:MAG: dihydrodipicolinate synthase family protein [Myxococcota bacterium]|nr:dihydrodipicolinate synthase family protein [Myxococcota bacterium]